MDGFKRGIAENVSRGRIKWQRHAFERMLERDINRDDVKEVLTEGEIIEEYFNDYPLPSSLYLGFVNEKPLHVVVALDSEAGWCYIITVYRPDLKHFEQDYKTRKS